MGCGLSKPRTKPVAFYSGDGLAGGSNFQALETSALNLGKDVELRAGSRNSFDLAIKASPCLEVNTSHNGDMEPGTTTYGSTLAAVLPDEHICMSVAKELKGTMVHACPLQVKGDLNDTAYSVDQVSYDWLKLGRGDILPYTESNRPGDVLSERWSTHLSPTMRSEASLTASNGKDGAEDDQIYQPNGAEYLEDSEFPENQNSAVDTEADPSKNAFVVSDTTNSMNTHPQQQGSLGSLLAQKDQTSPEEESTPSPEQTPQPTE
ncbi:unnamed protein product [Calicophoron daubneyi]|uniref:Uncharacterized protein n=1 Tax=Calicophoron daubneyi TaxID=300641 RepID=A0AAV2SZV3_CALDB